MRLEMTGQMRLEQRMKLTPHMIQSMEILQLPILALQERIEQELNSNPVLELEESADPDSIEALQQDLNDDIPAEKDLIIDTEDATADDFERLECLGNEFHDFIDQSGPMRSKAANNEVDRKQQALNNTAAPPQSLYQYLVDQWILMDINKSVQKAGERIIDFIDNRGYLSVALEQLHNKDNNNFNLEDLQTALTLIQSMEPAGVGARDLGECLLIQMRQYPDDMSFEINLVKNHMHALLDNKMPQIAEKMHCSMERLNQGIQNLSKFDTSPGLLVSQTPNRPITPDVIVEAQEDGDYIIRLVDQNIPALRLNDYYIDMVKDRQVETKTRHYLRNNMRSAQWIIDAIEQRNTTLLRVTRAIVKHQKDFFDKGQEYLKPLPMARVAQDVGVHIATISRAVSGKYMQCAWGVLALRKFFSGGKADAQGQQRSWEAIRVQLQRIIDQEDKTNPLNDQQISDKLTEAGFSKIARRTVSKYRGILNIPTAHLRKKYESVK